MTRTISKRGNERLKVGTTFDCRTETGDSRHPPEVTAVRVEDAWTQEVAGGAEHRYEIAYLNDSGKILYTGDRPEHRMHGCVNEDGTYTLLINPNISADELPFTG